MQHFVIFRNRNGAKRREPLRKWVGSESKVREAGVENMGSGRFRPPCPSPHLSPHIEGGVGIFGFGHFLDRFFRFRTKKLRFFGFGVFCGLRVFLLLAFGFQFSANILAVFQIWQSLWFSVFPFGFWFLCSSDLNYMPQPHPKIRHC